ncbi:MAG: ArsB/NhaD family transporter [Thermotogae bacterium]|nr:ArsB/NhaD family transporter [Thermotogota bacterium]MCP5465785.1 ArsB/NhaD family transporter [Thermotogota bacterium]HOO74248.1 ArsB/NhaD family transporter [Tepiditoga sp.]
MNSLQIISLVVFGFVLFSVITHKINRTTAAMLGAAVVIASGIFPDQMEAFRDFIDFNTIFLLLGMMIFVNVLKKRNIFTYMGIMALKVTGKNLKMLYVSLIFIVAIISSVIDNVTTILIFVPISLAICDSLDIDYLPLILSEIFASNIGGTATIIGDPPNIMIASSANLTFMDFTKVMGPLAVLNLIGLIVFIFIVFRKELKVKIDVNIIKNLDTHELIEDKKEFIISFVLLGITIILFVFQHYLNLEASVVSIIAAFSSLLILERHEIHEILKDVEWESLLFFIALFIITGALEKTGVLEILSDKVIYFTKYSSEMFSGILMTLSAVISGFLDNIPFTAAMIPVTENVIKVNNGIGNYLWFYLSAGACLGGNMTAIGASANIIGLAMIKQFKNKRISFLKFMSYGFFIVIINLIISLIYFGIFFK